jgi:uncharacterized membrane protein YkvA (DUF1232 family)
MNSNVPPNSASQSWSWTNLFRDLNATWRLLQDPSVPILLKTVLPLLAFVYWVWPLDLIPGVPLDDIAVVLLLARILVALAPRDSVDRAFRGAKWSASNPGSSGKNTGNDGGSNNTHSQDGEVIETTWRVVK